MFVQYKYMYADTPAHITEIIQSMSKIQEKQNN